MKLLSVLLLSITIAFAADLNPPECGKRPLVNDINRIVNGTNAVRGDWGWQVALLNGGRFFCGGVLINKQWVVSAAHCFSSANPNPLAYQVLLGVSDRSNYLINEPWVLNKDVSKVIRHPSYNSAQFRNDISLIKLATPVNYNNYIVPACLANPDNSYDNDEAVVTGWGARFLNGGSITYLQQVKVPVLSRQRCKSKYGTLFDETTQLCASDNSTGLSGPCQGDSGGPLVVQRKDQGNEWEFAGVVSWGYDCGYGGVYTRVSAYQNWISTNIDANP